MNYFIDNIEITQTKTGNDFLRLTLSNPDDDFDEMTAVAVFNEKIIAKYQRMLADPNVQGDINKIPEDKRYFKHAIWVEVSLPEPMYRRWGSQFETTNSDGTKTVHQADDLITDKAGRPRVYDKFKVLCKETIDNETQERRWANGWGPTERGNAYISSFFVGIPKGNNPDAQQTAQPAQQQPAQQAIVPPVQGAPTQQQPVTQNPPYAGPIV